MPEKYLIKGGTPLKGKVKISGAKNAAIKEIAASLLTTEPLILKNVPKISDVDVDLEIVESLGVSKSFDGSSLVLQSSSKLSSQIPENLSKKSRASVITLGPLLARTGRVEITAPGGCAIGERPLDRHLAALECLGARFTLDGWKIVGEVKELRGGRIVFKKNTVMGTENALLASVLARGETEIVGAAQEPEVDDLISLLNKMGAQISRNADNPRTIYVQGVSELHGGEHSVIPDRNEAVTFAVAAVVTRGDVILEAIKPQDLSSFLDKLTQIGVNFSQTGTSLRVWADPETSFTSTEIETAPHPGFMTDWQQPMSLLLTQTSGTSLVHETVYEDRFKYLEELAKFGPDVLTYTPAQLGRKFEPERYNFNWEKSGEPKVFAEVSGPVNLKAAKVGITDLRAGATLVLAALAAKGTSEVSGVEHIERGYENFEDKLRGLGAQIEKKG